MKVIPLKIQAGISGLELPAAEYKNLDLTMFLNCQIMFYFFIFQYENGK